MLVALLLPLPAAAESSPAADGRSVEERIDRVVHRAMRKLQIPGLALAIGRDGQPVLIRGYGARSLPGGPAPDGDTAFALASVSKSLTAVGVMLLVQDGKVGLDDRIGRQLPSLPRSWQDVTVRQFMTHTSGIPEVPARDYPSLLAAPGSGDLALLFDPGSRQKYTNANFSVMGRLIEAVSGEPYLAFMRRQVFGPLGMSATGSYRTHLREHRADAYVWRRAAAVPAQPEMAPDGIPTAGLASTVSDLMKLVSALRSGRLVRQPALDAMFTPTNAPGGDPHGGLFTPGWQSRRAGDTTVIGKSGMITGYGAMVQMVPGRGVTLVMLWNLSGPGRRLWRESAEILAECCAVAPPGALSEPASE